MPSKRDPPKSREAKGKSVIEFRNGFVQKRRSPFAILAAFCACAIHPAAADTTLTILTHYTDAQRAPLTACLRIYESQHPGIRIVNQQAEIDDYLQTALTARLSGTAPDIYNVYSLWAAQLVGAGMLDKPPVEIQRQVSADYVPGTVDAIKVAGAAWGIPTEVSTFMLIYNKKLFQQAGIPAPPGDWDELVADAARMTRRNAQGKITTAGYAFGPTAGNSVYPFAALLLSRGLPLLSPNLDGTNLTAPAAIDVLTEESRLFSKGITDNTIQIRDFPSGAVGMMIFANWYKATLRQAFGAAMDETVGVAQIPAGDNWRTVQYAFFWGVDANSPSKRQAWDLLAWLNTPHIPGKQSCTGDMLGKLGAMTGNRNDLAASPDDYGDAFSKPFADAIASGRAGSLQNVAHNAEIQQILRLAIGRSWAGSQSPSKALADADRKIAAILSDTD